MSGFGFKDFIGNGQVVLSLKNMLAQSRLPHAMVFEGEKGLGKKTLAKAVASALVCENPQNGEPCGICGQCKKASTGHPDIVYINGDKDKVMIGVEYIREMRTDAWEKPVESSNKVYIILREMNESAQNALLKILEEPPASVYIIILTETSNNLLETVISRSSVFSLGGVGINDGAEYILKNFGKWEKEDITEALNATFGNIGGAIEMLSADKRDEIFDLSGELAKNLCMGNRAEFLININSVVLSKNSRKDCKRLLNNLSVIIKDASVIKLSPGEQSGSGEVPRLLALKTGRGVLEKYFEIIDNYAQRLETNPNMNLFVTGLCAELFSARQ